MSDAIISNSEPESNAIVTTLTLEQTAQKFRAAGIATTATKIADGIDQGAYPFGICIKGHGGCRKFEIYRRMVDEYISARV